MNTPELLSSLQELNFFAGYTPEARAAAEAKIRRNQQELLAGEHEEMNFSPADLQKFPALPVCFISFDHEWDNGMTEFLDYLKANSFGLFNPEQIEEEQAEDEVAVAYTLGGKRYSCTSEQLSGWISVELLETIQASFHEQSAGLTFHEMVPHGGQDAYHTICTAAAYQGLCARGLLPVSGDELDWAGWALPEEESGG